MLSSPFNLYLTCPRGFESECSQELKSIGIKFRKLQLGGVSFTGNIEDVYSVNYLSRTGMVLWIEIGEINIKNEDSIYSSIKNINWKEIFKSNTTFSFKCIQKEKRFKNTHYISLKSKDAVVDYFFKNKFDRSPTDKPLSSQLDKFKFDSSYSP